MHAEGLSQSVDHRERRISLTPLNPSNIGAVNPRAIRQGFLRQAQRRPESTNAPTKSQAGFLSVGHLDKCPELRLDSLQTRSIIAA